MTLLGSGEELVVKFGKILEYICRQVCAKTLPGMMWYLISPESLA